jgi:hypothetical protein
MRTPRTTRSPSASRVAAKDLREYEVWTRKADHPLASCGAASSSSRADPMCSISRDPGRDEYLTSTVVAPDAVFAVRSHEDGELRRHCAATLRGISVHAWSPHKK